MALYSSHDFLHIPSQCTVILVFNMKCTAFNHVHIMQPFIQTHKRYIL